MFYKTTTIVIRNLEKIPMKDFIVSSCKLKTCNCTKVDTFTCNFKIFDCKCSSAATRQSTFSAGHLILKNASPCLPLKNQLQMSTMIDITGAQPGIFQGRGVSLEGHFNKHFIYNTWKKGPTEKKLEVFSTRYS